MMLCDGEAMSSQCGGEIANTDLAPRNQVVSLWDVLQGLEEEVELAVEDEETEAGVGGGLVVGHLLGDVLHFVKQGLLGKGPIQAHH